MYVIPAPSVKEYTPPMRIRVSHSPGQRLADKRKVPDDWAWKGAFAFALTALMGSIMILVVAAEGGFENSRAPLLGPSASDGMATAPENRLDPQPAATVANSGRAAATAPPARPADPIVQRKIQALMESLPTGMSISLKRLDDGVSATHEDGIVFYAASLFKLAVLYEAEREQTVGQLDFSAPVFPDFSEDLGTSGELLLSEDGSLSVSDALYYMITVSDNASAVALMHMFKTNRIDQTLLEIGLLNTSLSTLDLPTTAEDMARLMHAIVSGQGLSREAAQHARSLLLAQTHRLGIPALLPAEVTVGNKTGTWDGARHDVAFVETSRGIYVVAILTDGSLSWEAIANVSRDIFGILA